tara:strand:- start:1467 stop:1745 length:279 start_codon:yes stop_codon:yes gene_type:complete
MLNYIEIALSGIQKVLKTLMQKWKNMLSTMNPNQKKNLIFNSLVISGLALVVLISISYITIVVALVVGYTVGRNISNIKAEIKDGKSKTDRV